MNHSLHPTLKKDFHTREIFLKKSSRIYSSEMEMQQGAIERRVYKSEAHTQATSNNAASSFPMSIELLAGLIDSTLLKTNATQTDFLNLFFEANKYLFRSVCVPPCYVSLAKEFCKNVLLCTVIGFPNGYTTLQNKIAETKEAFALGADEIDFVQNISFVKSDEWKNLEYEYTEIVHAAEGKITKLILETSLLTDAEIERCTVLAAQCGVSIIKTSTGFGTRGASEKDILLIRKVLENFFDTQDPPIGIKASGGISSHADAVKMIKLGATRIGTSRGLALLQI